MSSKLSVELLRMILENVDDKADLATICYVNKICCVCSQDILYRNIDVENYSGLKVCQTLAQSIHLTERVRSFSVELDCKTDTVKTIAMALQNMSSLRNLTLNFGDRYSPVLKRYSFSCDLKDDEILQDCLPNLTRVCTVYYWLPYLIPGRPVSEVSVLGSCLPLGASNLSIFALSTVPIEKLHIPYFYIYGEHVPRLASLFPSLAYLTISDEASPVRVPFHFSNHWILSKYAIAHIKRCSMG